MIIVNQFSGQKGVLLNKGETVTELRNVRIEEWIGYQSPGEVETSSPSRRRIDVSFHCPDRSCQALSGTAGTTGTGAEYSLRAVGRLEDGSEKEAQVPLITLKSVSRGEGSRVIFSDVPALS